MKVSEQSIDTVRIEELSAVLDVAIGLIVVFLILSIMASAVSEVVGNLLQRRSKGLEYFLTCTLVGSGINVKDFYEKTLLSQANRPHRLWGK